MTPRIAVFGTSHRLQGALRNVNGKVHDPNYRDIVYGLIAGKDFVFEEATGLGPTIAEDLTAKILGTSRYLDIDPHPDSRRQLGIEEVTYYSEAVHFYTDDGIPGVTSVTALELDSHEKRESFWLRQIKSTEFKSAFLVCGHSHALSMSFRLRAEGYDCDRSFHYAPEEVLCPLVDTHGENPIS